MVIWYIDRREGEGKVMGAFPLRGRQKQRTYNGHIKENISKTELMVKIHSLDLILASGYLVPNIKDLDHTYSNILNEFEARPHC